jgi:hypothetical protein
MSLKRKVIERCDGSYKKLHTKQDPYINRTPAVPNQIGTPGVSSTAKTRPSRTVHSGIEVQFQQRCLKNPLYLYMLIF